VCCEAVSGFRLEISFTFAQHQSQGQLYLCRRHTLRGRQERSTHYWELQYDADWPEVLTEGKTSLYHTK
jgi:hypothetical protein